MSEMEFRAYDKKERTLIYDHELWLPQAFKKLGHTEYPVHITPEGIQYTLDCLSNHYENDWEENVVTRYGFEIMQFTNLWDDGESRKKMYCNDIISFYRKGTSDLGSLKMIGRITLSELTGDWILVDKEEQFLEELTKAVYPQVIGNWFDNAELLD
ncbi:hypothetical protein SPFL3101_02821 [Sporomusaceae bacterium FL31]|nr:hypothetical protein SPFL3101_02821 [Sporomusaceae bacterium FL31]